MPRRRWARATSLSPRPSTFSRRSTRRSSGTGGPGGAADLAAAARVSFLATRDSAFVGYREAAGRSALIRKGAYYARAMLRGALWGQAAVALACVLLAALFFRAG